MISAILLVMVLAVPALAGTVIPDDTSSANPDLITAANDAGAGTGLYGNDSYDRDSAGTSDAGIVSNSGSDGETPATAGLADTPWPKYQYDLRNSGQSPYVGSQNNTPKWSIYGGTIASYFSSCPAIGTDGTLYISEGSGALLAINPDGTLKYRVKKKTNNWNILGPISIGSDGTLYAGCCNKYVYAVHPSNGTIKWKSLTGAKLYGGVAIGADGTIYVASDALYAFNHLDGSLKWNSTTIGNEQSSSTPAIGSDGTIYIGSQITSTLHAYNPDGTLKWSNTTGAVGGSPAIGPDGIIYVGSADGNLYAWNPDGTLKWTYATGWTTTAPPAVAADGTVYISFWTTTDGALYAVKPDGTLKWTYATGHGISSAPVIGADGTIYAGGYAWNPDGTLKWKLVGISPCIPAIGQDGTMYFGASNKYLYALPGVVTFTADQTAGPAPLAVRFTGTSDLNVMSWHWDFGDGATSDEQNPTHTYTAGGVYSVNLTIAYGNGTNTIVKTDYISAYSPPATGFTADPTSGNSPLSVTFTDRSTGAPTAWLWEFGDGTTSTEQNPTHTYTAAGTDTTTYTVNLTATNSAGSNTTSRTDFITLYSNPPIVSFTATPRVSTTVPLTVQFRDASAHSPTAWFWEFGDGTNSTEQNPTHTYATAGTYTVNLTATNIFGTGTASEPGFIAIIPPGPLPSHNCINLYVANDAGVKYDEPNGVRAEGVYRYVPNTYYFASSGGLNALSISDGTNPVITNTRNQSGTFYAVHAGGQSTMPDGILMLAVNGTIPDDFSVHIKSSGYNWTPPGPDTKNYGLPAEHNYVDGAVDETFTKDDFIYGPQIWKPCSAANYPLHHGQNMSDTENAFRIMFIDLNAGATKSLPDGQIKIEYQFNNLTTFAAFDVYAWYLASNHGTGIIMTNNVGESSYMVTGIPDTPAANFTLSTDSSDISSPVRFNDTSENIPQSWCWEFGDGATSTEQDPIHTYTTPGTYTVNLTVTNTKGTDTMVKTDCVTKVAAPVPVADFAANVVPLVGSPIQVLFSDRSTGIISSWLWDFGDGTTSTDPNPGHWYYTPGTYAVNLTATNSGGSTSCVKNITVSPAETAFSKEWMFESGTEEGFTGVDTWGSNGINVSVSSTAHDGAYALQCHVNRGTGYARAPLENVPDASIYRVDYWIQSSRNGYGSSNTGISIVDADGALIAKIGGGDTTFTDTDLNEICDRPANVWVRHVIGWEKDTGVIDHMVYDANGILLGSRQITRAASIGKVPAEIQCHVHSIYHHTIQYDSITLSCGSVADFTANVTSGDAPLAVQFTDTSTNSPTSWAWDFENDGIVDSTEQSPSFTYTAAGTYTVNLTVTNAESSNTKVKVDYITVTSGGSGGDAPAANFTATPISGDAPLAVQFNDTSSSSPTSWLWEFGDGVNSTEQNPAHTYADAGSYTVNLTATNGDGSNTLSRTGYITVDGGSYSGVLPGYTSIYVRPVNHDGIRWDYTGNSTYYINQNGGGLNAVHISTDPTVNAGQVTVSPDQNGTFYVTDTGGRGYQDEVVLLLAVNGTIPDDFSVRIKTSGYTWTPNVTSNTAPPTGAYTYQPTALDETFTKDDFTYGPQDWKPSGSDVWYPIFYGQDPNDSVNRFQLAFIDTRAGLLGNKHADYASLTDKGAVKVEYQFTNLSGHAAFSLYAWNNGTSQGQGMGWTNRLSGDGSSGYTVIPPSGATVPVAAFNGTPTAGTAPLMVQFTDLSTGSPNAWLWDFGDGKTSTERNPAHNYTTVGTYTVNLTVTNAAGSNSLVKTDSVTVTGPAQPDLTVSTLTPNNGEVFSNSDNTYTAKITNIGTGDAGAFAVGFNVSGVTGTVAVAGLAAGANTTVTWTDETVRTAGENVTVTATADPENTIAEADEENNRKTLDKTVVNNGYRGKRWTAGEDIMTVKTYDVRGDLAYSSGTSTYLSAGTGWTNDTVTWTSGDLMIPANATITAARLYVPYTEDKGPVFPANVSLTLNGVAVEGTAHHTDEKMWGTSYPCGMTVYDVTDVFSTDGNTAVLANAFPGGGNVSVRGMLLAVVYDDGVTAPHTIVMNEGFDLLYGGASQGTTPEQATAYAPFAAVESGATGARLITVAPGAGPTEGDLLFNGETFQNAWNYTGASQIGVDERNVTALLAGENLAAFQSSADYMEAAAAFLVVEYPLPTGSIAVTSTPAGAAVWLDGEDTGLATDCTLPNVPAGDHVVTLKLDGYADASAPVTVLSGETATVALTLTTLTGSLTVTSTPTDAAILIDGAETGEVTDATLDGIAVGTHTVTLRKDGYVDASAEVTIEYNATATLHLDLARAAGSIAVTSAPDGGAIFLDGTDTGRTTNATLEDVPAGDHTVTVKKPGYADASKTVTVADNETATVSFALTVPAGSIAVTSAPDGARIFLDDLETGEVTNATLTGIPAGAHTVRVELDGYQEAEATVTVAAGGTASCHLNLEKIMVAPVADFSADVTSGTAPLTVAFSDTSTGDPTSWAWDFDNDGAIDSTEQNPEHTYAAAGTYAVSLTVTNAAGSNTTTKADYITVSNPYPQPLPAGQSLNLYVANDEGVKYNVENGVTDSNKGYSPYVFINNTYHFLYNGQGGGTNALHVSNDPSVIRGQVTQTTNQSGEFWLTFTGGQPNLHDAVLLLAVNGTIPDDFSVRIRSSGYDFEPPIPGVGNNNTIGTPTYVDGAINQTFMREDFIYGPQIWRPHRVSDYPIFVGQDMSDTENTFELMFIDLRLGCTQTKSDGYVRVEYDFNNLTTFAVFNAYGWYSASNHGTGLIMTTSGTEYQVARPVAPVANFTAAPTSGNAPLNVTFTDLSTNSPTSWAWDFDNDGIVDSTEQSPTHIYTTAGTYTVNLTVGNTAGSDTEVKIDYVTTDSSTPVANFTATPLSGEVPLTVQFTDTSTNVPTSWAWDFENDGIVDSTEQNPSHTYSGIGRFNVTLTVGNAFGTDTLTRVRYITARDVPPGQPEREENFTFRDNGTNVTDVGGRQQVSFNNATGNGTTGDYDIILTGGNMNVTIRTDGLTTTGNVSTGNVTGVQLESSPIRADLGGDVGNVSVGFNASMNSYNPDLGITTAIYDQPSGKAATAFTLAATDKGLAITSTAYAVYFTKTNPAENISNAVLRMTVSPAWVNASGGPAAIRVFRQDDDGNVEMLATTYLGPDADGMMVFEAISPGGFSAFAVAATQVVDASTSVPETSSSSGGGGRSAIGVGAAENIRAGETATLTFGETPVTEIEVHARDGIPHILITTKAGTKPDGADDPDGDVYEYVSIACYRAPEDSLQRATIRFTVPTNWVDERLSSPDTLSLYHYNEETGEWTLLSTVFAGEENGGYAYYADSASFGYFAVVVKPDVKEVTASPEETPVPRDTEQRVASADPATTPRATPLFSGGMIVCVAVALFCVLVLLKRRLR